MLKFYFNGSPNPTKVALMLEETGLAYTPVAIDTRKGEQFAPDFVAINPNAKVPVIVDGDAEGLRGVDDLLCHLDVGGRRRRVAGRVVVDEDDGGR